MTVAIIPIGNSKGIRIPKSILDQYHITDSIELILEKNSIILKPKQQPRSSWKQAFKKMHTNGHDKLLIDDVFEDENFGEWK